MNLNDPNSDQLIARYLLGKLNEDDRRLIEERFFDDDQVFERLLELEERLIQAYAAGTLSGDDRQRFEDYFLISPKRREKVESAKALARRRTGDELS